MASSGKVANSFLHSAPGVMRYDGQKNDFTGIFVTEDLQVKMFSGTLQGSIPTFTTVFARLYYDDEKHIAKRYTIDSGATLESNSLEMPLTAQHKLRVVAADVDSSKPGDYNLKGHGDWSDIKV